MLHGAFEFDIDFLSVNFNAYKSWNKVLLTPCDYCDILTFLVTKLAKHSHNGQIGQQSNLLAVALRRGKIGTSHHLISFILANLLLAKQFPSHLTFKHHFCNFQRRFCLLIIWSMSLDAFCTCLLPNLEVLYFINYRDNWAIRQLLISIYQCID